MMIYAGDSPGPLARGFPHPPGPLPPLRRVKGED